MDRGYDDEMIEEGSERSARAVRPRGSAGRPYGPAYGFGYGPAMRFRPPVPIETKPFFLTSEFFGVLLLIAAMAIGAATSDGFDARLFWILTTAIASAYVLSRGVAKSGTKSRSYDPREELELFGGERGDRD